MRCCLEASPLRGSSPNSPLKYELTPSEFENLLRTRVRSQLNMSLEDFMAARVAGTLPDEAGYAELDVLAGLRTRWYNHTGVPETVVNSNHHITMVKGSTTTRGGSVTIPAS